MMAEKRTQDGVCVESQLPCHGSASVSWGGVLRSGKEARAKAVHPTTEHLGSV